MSSNIVIRYIEIAFAVPTYPFMAIKGGLHIEALGNLWLHLRIDIHFDFGKRHFEKKN